ncbi:1-acyl-sn-glycerol-3-phosphate acyltransferase [Actinoallomurus rhizosphaericola]|uniref:1-acyl-sn-glycerol-3-phosphate acyltransferase n=1 Tax=Actinoallomurus rhizosphaericola TaxID=2952536 RepID=UPI00209116B7|nr:1-acyl-sn-glycerol-3-phosphate acyltransferase [Actinoallomurus rhizosphaericola]MCO5992038.1 1-acyl-sn-glycerol-3-phosphate acyltransferase [Actinoallomurus rhizosphaericola]
MLPPRFVRRLVLTPLLFAVAIAAVAASPLLLLIGVVAAGHRHRLLRVVVLTVCWLALECAVLTTCLGLWVAGGSTETVRARHYALCGWLLARVDAVAARTLGLVVEIQEPLGVVPGRPVIVLSRHGGPGDSLLIVHYLLNVYGRRPRIVMKAALQLDPTADVLLNRLPNAFVPPNGSASREGIVDEIGRLATGIGPADALLIFPEGGNFTPRRRVRAIRRLRRQGRRDAAERARNMANVLPPRPAGSLAAIDAAPQADIVFVAHTGVDDLMTAGDIWRSIPLDRPLRARWWWVPREEIPEDGREQWLFDWWEKIDAWIADNRPRSAV